MNLGPAQLTWPPPENVQHILAFVPSQLEVKAEGFHIVAQPSRVGTSSQRSYFTVKLVRRCQTNTEIAFRPSGTGAPAKSLRTARR